MLNLSTFHTSGAVLHVEWKMVGDICRRGRGGGGGGQSQKESEKQGGVGKNVGVYEELSECGL